MAIYQHGTSVLFTSHPQDGLLVNFYIPHNRRMPLQAEEALGPISIPQHSQHVPRWYHSGSLVWKMPDSLKTMGATSGAGTKYLSLPTVFGGNLVARSLLFCVVFYILLFFILSFLAHLTQRVVWGIVITCLYCIKNMRMPKGPIPKNREFLLSILFWFMASIITIGVFKLVLHANWTGLCMMW